MLVESFIRQQDQYLLFHSTKKARLQTTLLKEDKPCKIKLKISNCFRTKTSAHIHMN